MLCVSKLLRSLNTRKRNPKRSPNPKKTHEADCRCRALFFLFISLHDHKPPLNFCLSPLGSDAVARRFFVIIAICMCASTASNPTLDCAQIVRSFDRKSEARQKSERAHALSYLQVCNTRDTSASVERTH